MGVSHINDEVYLFVDQEVIFIKAVSSHGDPSELSVDEAKALIARLAELIAKVDT